MCNFILKIFILCSFLAGCAAHAPYLRDEDKNVPKNQLAYIESESVYEHDIFYNDTSQVIQIIKIDGNSVFSLSQSITSGEDFPISAYLIPGRHTISLQYTQPGRRAFGEVWLEAEAGVQYVIKKEIVGYGIKFWVENKATGQKVGGISGGDTK